MGLTDILILLGLNLAVIVAVMVGLWGVSIRLKDVSVIDAAWPLSILLLALATWPRTDGDQTRTFLLLWLVGVWAVRLGVRLIRRWRVYGADARCVGMLERQKQKRGWSFARTALLLVFLPQAFLAWLVSLPVQLGQVASDPAVGWIAWSGAALVVIGIALASIGDAQLSAFTKDPANRGKVLAAGLWRYTRHPGYFGDACVWWGLYLIAAETTPGLWSIAGPIVLTATLIRWSGIGVTERAVSQSRPGYADYVKRTSAFIPWPPNKSA